MIDGVYLLLRIDAYSMTVADARVGKHIYRMHVVHVDHYFKSSTFYFRRRVRSTCLIRATNFSIPPRPRCARKLENEVHTGTKKMIDWNSRGHRFLVAPYTESPLPRGPFVRGLAGNAYRAPRLTEEAFSV